MQEHCHCRGQPPSSQQCLQHPSSCCSGISHVAIDQQASVTNSIVVIIIIIII